MTWARRALGRTAAAWLVCQAVTLALVPALLGGLVEACVCTHGADATCPMHHKPTAGAKVCVMQSANTGVPGTLSSLFSIAGLLPPPTLPTVAASMTGPVLVELSRTIGRSSPPDPPPPRA
jgi:hypothetical protein